ncbi:MAG: TRAP transporter large permease subunit [Myxococcota bacterium]|nr:TRAP transporter large permease subunit [Myxococcota bacterium]
MNPEYLGAIMFVTAFFFIFSGYPVAFALGGTALLFSVIGIAIGELSSSMLLMFPQRVFGVMSNQILLAVPFFILMGTMLEKSKLAEDLLVTIGELFGSIRGGLALAVVFVGTLLAAATGVVGASVVAMGLISMPLMLKSGYSKELSCGVITASGTLGQIIPPSVVLVVLADQLGVSVGDLFIGSLTPGLMLASFFALYVLVYAFFKPDAAPALKREGSKAELFRRVIFVLLPPLVLILLVLGSIFGGLATPTEAGALGAIGAMLLAGLNRRFSVKNLFASLDETIKLSAMVMFLLVGSTAFALVFRLLGGEHWIQDILTSLPGGAVGLIVIANFIVFILGFFIDFFEIAFIILPLLVPAAEALGINLIWFGVLLGMNLQTSFLTPPFGFSLFYLRGAAPEEVETKHIYKGAIPFIIIQIVALLLVFFFPEIVTWLIPTEETLPR